MQVLVVKMSSMGDVIHTLPALTDASKAIGNISFDWLVEPAFQEIPKWHPAVGEVIVAPLRQWRGKIWSSVTSGELARFFAKLREKKYAAVIDAQGLIKSAILARMSRSKRYCGLNYHSAREGIASLMYNATAAVPMHLHAIERTRQLFAASLSYPLADKKLDYGVVWQNFPSLQVQKPYLFFLHGTTWATKHWPEQYWQRLAEIAGNNGFDVYMTWAGNEQKERVTRLSSKAANIKMLPHLSINEAVRYLQAATAVVAVDTGFGHLASALGKPLVSLYGPTCPSKVGVLGDRQCSLAANDICKAGFAKTCCCVNQAKIFPACLASLRPEFVWEQLFLMLAD